MLKASFDGKYRKTSGWIYRYVVTGPAVELTEYTVIMATRANRTPEEWAKTQAGLPLFFLQLNNLLRNGEFPQASYSLVKSHDGLNFYTDTTAQEMAEFAQIKAASIQEQGKLAAQIKMGIINVGNNTPATSAPATPKSIAAPADTIGSIIEGELGEDAVLEGEGAAAGAAGTGAIGD